MTAIFLASKSPRRQQLLRILLDSFLVINPGIEEIQAHGEACADFVHRLAREKALSAGKRLSASGVEDALIIAADTIVVDGGEVLGKPRDGEDAWRILQQLKGKTHQVMSGIGVLLLKEAEIFSKVVITDVKMRAYTDREIRLYIASGDPDDKAGAYGIQNRSFDPAPEFSGCFANVMGLPLCSLSLLMGSAGCLEPISVAERCQESIPYRCPVYHSILADELGHHHESLSL